MSKHHQLDNHKRHFSICDSEHILESTELRVGYITGLVQEWSAEFPFTLIPVI